MFSNLKMIRRAGSAVSLAMVTLWCGLAGPASIHAQELTEPAGATLDGSQATRSGPAIRLPRASLQPAVPTRRLSVAEAVTMGLEQNLDLQVERLNPQLQDLSVLDARSVYAPTLSTTFIGNNRDSPTQTIFESGDDKVTDRLLQDSVSVLQAVPFAGGSYAASWDNSHFSTTNIFSSFDPILRSNLRLNYTQPLLRDFGIDTFRQRIAITRANRDLSDIQLRASIVQTARSVQLAYWGLYFARSSLEVQRQSLDLALESLANNRRRVEVGTLAAIDIVQAESEVARNEEALIVAEAAAAAAEDQLRALVLDADDPDFWEISIEMTDSPVLQPRAIDVPDAIRNALESRTDLDTLDNGLEANDIDIRYFRNQRLPDVSLSLDYRLSGLGGTELIRTGGFPGTIVGEEQTSFGSALGDIFTNQFPNWTVGVTVSYPFGTSSADANLERARLERTQAQVRRRSLEVRVAAEVRDVGRRVSMNLQRVEATQTARELAERRLEAEQRRFDLGLQANFFVVQAQRDLAAARNSEQRAILDYSQSLVDFDAVQEVPLFGGF